MEWPPQDTLLFGHKKPCCACRVVAPAGPCAFYLPLFTSIEDIASNEYLRSDAVNDLDSDFSVADCYGVLRSFGVADAGTLTLTVDASVRDELSFAASYAKESVAGGLANRASVYTSLAVAEGAVLTIDWSAVDSVQAALEILDAAWNVVFSQATSEVSSGSFVSSPLPRGEYYVQVGIELLGGVDAFDATVHIASSAAMVANPVISLWSESGNVRYIDACPRLELPLAGSPGAYYDAESTAQSALDDDVVGCAAYFDPNLTAGVAFTTRTLIENVVGASWSYDASVADFEALVTVAAVLEAGTTSVEFAMTGAGVGSFARIALIDAVTWDEVDSQSGGVDVSSGTITLTVPFEGRFYLRCEASFEGLADGGTTEATFDFGDIELLPAVALYDRGLSCPARLNCAD